MAFIGATVIVSAGLGIAVSTVGIGLGITLGVLVTGLIACAARRASLVAIPLFLVPWEFSPGGVDTRTALVGALEIGVLLGQVQHVKRARSAYILALALGALVLTSLFKNSQAVLTLHTSVVNHAFTLVLVLLLVPTFALARPGWTAALGTLALSGTFLSVYSLFFGLWEGGRNQLNEVVNANATGHFAAVATMACVVMAVLQSRRIWLVPAVLCLTEAVLTQSRGGFIALAAGIVVLWLTRLKNRTRGAYIMFTVAAVIVVWPALVWGVKTLFSLRDANYLETDAREQVARLAIRLALDHPINGIGYRVFLDRSYVTVGAALDTHNDYLRIAAEIGLVAFVLLMVMIAIGAFRMVRADANGRVYLALAVSALAVFAFSNSMTELRVSTPAWVLLGLAFGHWAKRGDAERSRAVGSMEYDKQPGQDLVGEHRE